MAYQILHLSPAAFMEINDALLKSDNMKGRVMQHGYVSLAGIALALDEGEGEQMGVVPGTLPCSSPTAEITSVIQTVCEVNCIDDDQETRRSPKQKPFLRLLFGGGRDNGGLTLEVTTNLGEMIGGAAAGLRKRYEDKLARSH